MPHATESSMPNGSNTNPIQQFDSMLASREFLMVVYFRGHWCPFCTQHLTTLRALRSRIIAANGMALIVTAEDASHLPATRKSTGYGGPAIVDPEHVLLEELKRRGWLDVAVSPRAGYEKGMAQPGVLVVRRDGSVVYEWAIRPSLMNLGGAKDRPNLEQAFDNAEAAMSGGVGPHKVISKQTFLQGIRHKIFG